MIATLKAACSICESGSALANYKHLVFEAGRLHAFNGVVQVQAPTDFSEKETFAVNEERLLQALSACEGEDAKVTLKDEFLVLKRGKLTVRVRKLPADNLFRSSIPTPPVKRREKIEGLQEALREVVPFMSTDASRPWTTSVLLKDRYAWATNNLSLVRFPLASDIHCILPAPALEILCALEPLDWIALEEGKIVVGSGKLLISFPSSSAAWPESIAGFFAKAPKKLPKLDAELREATQMVEKFAERFVSLRPEKVEGKLATIESEYEIEVPKGKGTYPAKLLLLILQHATHADFSTYPEPIFFAGDKLRGVAVGAKT